MIMKNLKYLFLAFVLNCTSGFAQETLNTEDPNSFIFGGDQNSNTASIQLLAVSLVDVEPDPGNSIDFGINASDLEAGLPVIGSTGSGSSINENLWLNFTYRARNYANATIHVYANQSVPQGIILKIQVIGTGGGGDYPKNPNYNLITLSEFDQVIVYDFASGYTDDGENNGFQLRYTLENTGGASLPPGFEIIYEIKPPGNN